ncbi:unnamed protein product [Danaus chrysippus]|uniref:(African queen) hypothetical protein n=1 Tax=Danaus chrysippus TaxID=151541 RepID=A0A8J2R369_9NEOP|nr:unnamed protein product [Danaus chrysippus]
MLLRVIDRETITILFRSNIEAPCDVTGLRSRYEPQLQLGYLHIDLASPPRLTLSRMFVCAAHHLLAACAPRACRALHGRASQ